MSFSSLYVGATGVVAHNASMSVLANNLANVSTTGYRKSDAQFGTLMSQQVAAAGATYQSGSHYVSQVGKGVAVSEIRTIFSEGGLENTNTVTDLAITGNGFFGTRNTQTGGASGATHYTRAGAFRFDNDAYLVDVNGYRLQGYAVDRETGEVSGAVGDVQLPYEDLVVDGQTTRLVRSDPLATSNIEMVTNLDHTASDLFTSDANPFFSMLQSYDAQQSNAAGPFGSEMPEYSSSLLVYDSEGNDHELTVFFDPVSTTALSDAVPGYSYWEYMVTIPADSDGSSSYGTSAAGLVGMGVMVFDGQGQMTQQTAFTLDPSVSSGAGGKSLGSWTTSTFSEDGVPQFNVQFGSNGGAVGDVQAISYDFGISSGSGSWQGGSTTAAGVGVNAGNLAEMGNMNRDARVSTNYDLPSATLYQLQDGYSWGYLQYASVDREGFLNGHFTNGQTEQLFQVAVYSVTSPWGMRRDGNTNFVSTEASGEPVAGAPGTQSRGVINQNSLEQSNVDMAEEFANMILTQRGYQANTKVITTSDSILNTLISTKR